METVAHALLAIQRALLDVVTPELRAVLIDLDNHEMIYFVRFYYDGEISQDLIELWDCAITEASASLGADYTTDQGIERIDYPKKIPFRGS